MKEDFAPQASEMLGAVKSTRIPDNLQDFAQESIVKTRDAYREINTVAKDGAKAVEELMLTAQAGAKALGEKIMANVNKNMEGAFDAAQTIARARTMTEIARLQVDMTHEQLTIANQQMKELIELSAEIAKHTLDTVNGVVTMTFEQLRRIP